jgi:hypothetical protein
MAIPRIFVWMADDRFESYPSAKSSRFPESTFLGAMNPLYVLAYADLGLTREATTNSNPTDEIQLVNVTQCAISFCLKTYEVSVVAGVTSTKVKNEEFGVTYMANISGQDNPSTCWKPNRPIDEASNPQAEAKVLSHDRLVATNSTGFGFCELGSGLDLERYPNLQGEFQELYRWEHSASSNESSWYGPYNTAGGNIDVLFWIHRVGFETVMDRVATSLSKFGRDNSGYTVSGKMAVSESFVNVEWPWIILPPLLVVSTICLLILTIIMTSHRRVNLWKTSIIPFLFNGPGNDLAAAHGGTLTSLSEMERHSKTIQLKLAASNTESRLVLCQQD